MTRYPIRPKDFSEVKPSEELKKRKEERKNLLEKIWKKRAEIIRKMSKW